MCFSKKNILIFPLSPSLFSTVFSSHFVLIVGTRDFLVARHGWLLAIGWLLSQETVDDAVGNGNHIDSTLTSGAYDLRSNGDENTWKLFFILA